MSGNDSRRDGQGPKRRGEDCGQHRKTGGRRERTG